MEFPQRLELLARLRTYLLGNDASWQEAKQKAFTHNAWFIPQFIDTAVNNISEILLNPLRLQQWDEEYGFGRVRQQPASVGVIMAGNIPLAGFYQFLTVFAAGHRQRIRLSPKDEVLMRHMVRQMAAWDPEFEEYVSFSEMLKGCDAYIASLEHNTSSQFEVYFSRYPNYMTRSGTSAAVLTGNESRTQLETLAGDVFEYFGRGALNVTRLYVPRNFDFIPLIKSFDHYRFLIDHNKYKNNYDYQLSLLILNKAFYMTNGCILLTENASAAAPVAMLHYSYYDTAADVNRMAHEERINRLVGMGYQAEGQAGQSVAYPGLDAGLLQFLRDL